MASVLVMDTDAIKSFSLDGSRNIIHSCCACSFHLVLGFITGLHTRSRHGPRAKCVRTIIADALHGKVEELKNGHGAVLESGHLLVLGWSDKVLGIVLPLVQFPTPFLSCLSNKVHFLLSVLVLSPFHMLLRYTALQFHNLLLYYAESEYADIQCARGASCGLQHVRWLHGGFKSTCDLHFLCSFAISSSFLLGHVNEDNVDIFASWRVMWWHIGSGSCSKGSDLCLLPLWLHRIKNLSENAHLLVAACLVRALQLPPVWRRCLACVQIVILSDKCMDEMRATIEENDINLKSSRLVLRHGCILSVSELKKVSAMHARSVLRVASLPWRPPLLHDYQRYIKRMKACDHCSLLFAYQTNYLHIVIPQTASKTALLLSILISTTACHRCRYSDCIQANAASWILFPLLFRSILILADHNNPCSDARTLRCMTCLQHPSVAPPEGAQPVSKSALHGWAHAWHMLAASECCSSRECTAGEQKCSPWMSTCMTYACSIRVLLL